MIISDEVLIVYWVIGRACISYMNNRLLNYFVSSKDCPFIEQHFQDQKL